MLPVHRVLTRPLHQIASTRAQLPRFSPLPALSRTAFDSDSDAAFLSHFRTRHFQPARPVFLPGQFASALPAVSLWFHTLASGSTAQKLRTSVFHPHASTPVALELWRPGEGNEKDTFERFTGPLELLVQWVDAALGAPDDHSDSPVRPGQSRLYLAQTPLTDLPSELSSHLPTPDIVRDAGKGDVYGTSLWMGVPPTRTPLHRDPNPNLLVQLAGKKVVRMLTPEKGAELMELGGIAQRGNSPGMDETMMVGESMGNVERLVWEDRTDGPDQASMGADVGTKGSEAFEVHLEGGDGVFIPSRWWHSVRGCGEGITSSANWWFR